MDESLSQNYTFQFQVFKKNFVVFFRKFFGFLLFLERSIPPKTIGGIGGGSKYIKEGILFKLPMLNQNYPTQEDALKAAGKYSRVGNSIISSEIDSGFSFVFF